MSGIKFSNTTPAAPPGDSLVTFQNDGAGNISASYATGGSASFNGVNAQTGTSYTLQVSDDLKLVTFNNASPVAVTLPHATGFASTWVVFIQNLGAGVVTITPTTSTIDGASSLVVNQDSGVVIFGDGTNYFTERGMSSGGGSGTVTSVAVTVPADESVSGSPVTTSGTIAITRNTQAANKALMGPTTGIAATPAFRTFVTADIPNLDTSKLTTGQLALARGGTAADLSSSGSATAFLAQDASHVVTARSLVAADYPTMVGDTGSGGTKGAVPGPSSGDAAAGKFLKADGTFAVPPGNNASEAINQTAHGFSVGNAIYYTGSAWALAKSDAVGTLGIGVVGIVAGVNDFTVYYSGYLTGLSGLTAGQYYFVSDASAGLLTSTEPTTVNHYSNPLFFALTTTTGVVLPFRPNQIASALNPPGSISISVAANPTALNLTTEGTGDWLCPNGISTLPSQIAAGSLHAKAQSLSLLISSFAWIFAGLSCTIFTQTHTKPALTATPADDTASTALTSAVNGQGIFSGSGGVGYGFRLVVPADTFARTLRIYSTAFSAVSTCSCNLSDGSVSTSANFDTGAGLGIENFFTIVYNAPENGQFLEVTITVTTNHGSSPNVKFLAATLA